MTVGVLVMAHGTPANTEEIEAFYTRIRRGPPARAGAAGRAGRPLPGHRRHVAARRPHPGPGGRIARARSRRRAPGRYRVAFGAKHTDPLLEDAASQLAASGVDKVIGLVLTPHASSMGSREYLERAAARSGHDPVHRDRVVVRRAGVRSAAGRAGTCRRRRTRHRALPRRSSPPTRSPNGCGRPVTPTPSSSRSRPAWSPPRPVWPMWSVAWQSAGRTPEPWLGPDIRDEVRRLAAEGADRRRGGVSHRLRGRPPRGALRPRHRAGAAWPPRSASPTPARRRSTTIPPSSTSWPTS